MDFLFFCYFLKNEKIPVNFFDSEEAPWQGQSNGAKFIAICCLIRELWAFKWFSEVKII
jgi:hypothetical protein